MNSPPTDDRLDAPYTSNYAGTIQVVHIPGLLGESVAWTATEKKAGFTLGKSLRGEVIGYRISPPPLVHLILTVEATDGTKHEVAAHECYRYQEPGR